MKLGFMSRIDENTGVSKLHLVIVSWYLVKFNANIKSPVILLVCKIGENINLVGDIL